MKNRLPLALVAGLLPLAGMACAPLPAATPAEVPNVFLAGFRAANVIRSVNAMPDGPRYPRIPTDLPPSHAARDSSFGGRSTAEITTDCEESRDGAALAQALAAGIDAELGRLGASVGVTGRSETASGAAVTDTWEYQSSGLRGQIRAQVLAAPEGRYWVVVRIFEAG